MLRFFAKTIQLQRNNVSKSTVFRNSCCYLGSNCNESQSRKYFLNTRRSYDNSNSVFRCYCTKILEGDVSCLRSRHITNEQNRTQNGFPEPKLTLHNYQQKVGNKVFDVTYKRKTAMETRKSLVLGNWTCVYCFMWPEEKQFEGSGKSKRTAGDEAATKALEWLKEQKKIDQYGSPVLDRDKTFVSNEELNTPLAACISENSIERINRIWEDYENGIKQIYDRTHEEALSKMADTPVVFNQDSSIDIDDEFTEDDLSSSDISNISELKQHSHPVYGRPVAPPSEATLNQRQKDLDRIFQNYHNTVQKLPIDEFRDKITSTLQSSRVTILVGAAGCGKSTRVPAAILENFGAKTAAIVSEPRRVAAIGLANRVAFEMGEKLGQSIGYQVRLSSNPPRLPGAILFCTSGVLLKRLQVDPGLTNYTHVLIDEAHERDVNTDLTLLLLKRALDINPQLKLVIMSATLDVHVFTRYFNNCPVIEVPGRTFPVKISYLDDLISKYNIRLPNSVSASNKYGNRPNVCCSEIVEVIKAIDRQESEGAILVFLPGWAEIKNVKQLLDEEFGESNSHLILPVHSRLSTEEQTLMFTPPNPNIRKIVLSTNIAETSVTVPDVVHVLDSGALRGNCMRPGTDVSSLETLWLSRAAAKQRAGRAGRVKPGNCYRMYTKEKETEFVEYSTPEILRVPLEQVVLDCKTYAPGESVESFLSQLPEPPSKRAVEIAVKDLIEMGAFTSQQNLTAFGAKLSQFTLHPRLASCALNSLVLCNSLFAANICAYLSADPRIFANEMMDRDAIREFLSKYSVTSDHAALHMIQDEFEQILNNKGKNGVSEWCEVNDLLHDRLYYVRALSNIHLEQLIKIAQIMSYGEEAKQIGRYSEVEELNTALLLASCDKLLTAKLTNKKKGDSTVVKQFYTSTGQKAHISSSSVNYSIKRSSSTQPELLTYFDGFHSVDRRALVVYKTSQVSPQMAVLFCKGNIDVNHLNEEETLLSIPRHKLEIVVPSSQAPAILKAREMLWRTFQYFQENDPSSIDEHTKTTTIRFRVRLVKALGKILVDDVCNNNNVEDQNVKGSGGQAVRVSDL